MSKPRLGDVVEIGVGGELAYALFTHSHKQFGSLIRVFSERYKSRPESLDVLLDGHVGFSCFFPLGAAMNKGSVTIIGNVKVREDLRQFPVFRDGVADPATGKVAVWWLWDGVSEWKVGELAPEQRELPIRAVWNDALLFERIASGWTAESDQE